ncbi:hypothetical protein D6C81_01054 [Aureobasidium pullulans]|nr:hypothetical protein D6C81_01054 [Aureobasidium pullulans]
MKGKLPWRLRSRAERRPMGANQAEQKPSFHFSTSSNPTYADPAPSTHSIAPVSNKSTAMSAPNAGRQSPEPENQSSKQQAAPTAGNPNQQGAEPNEGSKQASDNQKDGLSSNPTGPLDQAAKEKTSKST